MTFVSLLAIGLLIAFGSTVLNLRERYDDYLYEYGYVDEQITTSLSPRDDLRKIEQNVEGIEKLDIRLTLDAYLKKSREKTEKTLNARMFSYKEDENEIFKRYVLEKIEPNYEKEDDNSFKYVNTAITRKFAKNNNIKVGQTLVIGFNDIFIDLYVNEIIETAEGIYPRANEYIWSDNQNFGYLYVSESELSKGITNLANTLLKRIDIETTEEEKEALKEIYKATIELLGLPDFLDPDLDISYVSNFGNQLLIKNKKGYSEDTVLNSVTAYLDSVGISYKKALKGSQLPYRVYMENAQRQLRIASVFLPVFFYSVTMIIIGLFMNQIIKNMTSQIGIMISVGVGKWDIISLFLLFAALVGLSSGILGTFLGWGLNAFLTSILIETYSIPTLLFTIKPVVAILGIVALIVFAEVATLISCVAIFRITPKDAVISNEAKRKKNPKWVNKLIDISPVNIKLGLNSIFQNPKRFIVSAFSIFASFVLIMLCCNFYVSKEAMISQSVNKRLNFDCQVYMLKVSSDDEINEIRNLECVDALEDCYYTYLKAENGKKSTYLEVLAMNENSTYNLVNIPDENGKGSLNIPESGLILPKSAAKQLNVKAGDSISFSNYSVKVEKISDQYFHPITYLSKKQLLDINSHSTIQAYVSSYLIDTNNQTALADYFTENGVQCLTVFTDNLSKDLKGIFDAVNIMIYIMIGFAFGIGFIILTIMSQNSLLEQRRSVSVLRLIGFTVNDVSNVWSLQSILQIIFSSLFSIPAGLGASKLLFYLASSPSQTYPFILSWPVIGIAFGFITLTVLICHGLSMLSIKKWNLADNTRSRE